MVDKHKVSCTRSNIRVRLRNLPVYALVVLLLVCAAFPTFAFSANEVQGGGAQAEYTQNGGVVLTRASIIRGEVFPVEESNEITIEDAVSPAAPGYEGMQKFYFVFSKNVAYANNGRDGAFVEHNKSLIKLVDDKGVEAEGYRVGTFLGPDDRQALFIFTTEWLKPLSTYQVIIEPGIQAANGVDVSSERYVITFTTNAECENGLNLWQNILIVVIPVLVLLGIVAAIIRRRKLRYG